MMFIQIVINPQQFQYSPAFIAPQRAPLFPSESDPQQIRINKYYRVVANLLYGDHPQNHESDSQSRCSCQTILTWTFGHVNVSCDVIGARYSEFYFTLVSFIKWCRTWTFQSHSIIQSFKNHSIIQFLKSFYHSIIQKTFYHSIIQKPFYHSKNPKLSILFYHSKHYLKIKKSPFILKTKRELLLFEKPKQ